MSRIGENLGLPNWQRRIDMKTAFPAFVCLFVVIVHFWAPTGFAGWDDWHYFQAAQRWIADGPHVPTDHWAARLPHVLLLAATMQVSGNELWLLLPGLAMFAAVLWCGSRLAGMAMGSETAIVAAGMLAFTPLLFRQASSFYPEGMEVACSAVAILLAFKAAQDAAEGRPEQTTQLLCAGAIGGLAVLVRQTALAVPAALALFLLIKQRSDPQRALISVATFGLGGALVVGCELAFYAYLTGDPLHRFVIDKRTLTLPSVHLKGGVFLELPLFNWKLAALWEVPELFNVHWTINPVLNLLFSPQVLFVPWLALGGLAMARRGPQPLRDLAFLTILILALQYFSFTYALALPPNIRYYSVSVFMLCLMAGAFVATRDKLLRTALILCTMAAAIFIASISAKLSARGRLHAQPDNAVAGRVRLRRRSRQARVGAQQRSRLCRARAPRRGPGRSPGVVHL